VESSERTRKVVMKEHARSESVFIKQLIIFNRYKVCVEIGVFRGGTTKYLCEAAKETSGHVYGFDLWGTHGLNKQFQMQYSQQSVEKILVEEGHNNFTLHKVDTTTQKFKEILLSECPVIDFAFIDGCHSYPGLKNDFDTIYPLLSPTGMIAFHDTLRIDGCREFVLDLRTKYYDGSYDIIDFPWGMGNRRAGLTILSKRQFIAINLPLDERCGSPSTPADIIKREKEWMRLEIQKNVAEQVDTSSIIVDKTNLGKLKKK